MDNTDDPELIEDQHVRRYRNKKKRKHKMPGSKLPLLINAFIILMVVIIMVIATGVMNRSTGVVSTKTPSTSAASRSRIPEARYNPQESNSLEEKLWQKREGALENK